MPIKKFNSKPWETVQKTWYPYDNDVGEMQFIEFNGKDPDDPERNLSSADRFSFSEIKRCVDMIVKQYGIHPDDIRIVVIALDHEQYTLDFSFTLKKSPEVFRKEIQEYEKAEREYKEALLAWKEFEKNQKIENLKKQLQDLENT